MKICYLTAGAAGMYCGSCLHDNAVAKALIRLGHDALLVPTYTPLHTDEADISQRQLFYGGLNVYLEQISPVFRWLPNWADQFLSAPWLVRWIASRAMGTSAANLGALTVSMLRGTEGNQRKEVRRLCDWLRTLQPDVVIFSNLLIAGCLPELQSQLGCPAVVVLQGDDIFYDGLIEPFRQQALTELRKLAQQVDTFVVHSQSYGDRMQQLLGFPAHKLFVNPLSIDVSDFVNAAPSTRPPDRPPTVGYLARLAPEKGLHLLVDALIQLYDNGETENAELAIAGWLGPQHAGYWQDQQDRLETAGLSHRVHYAGSVDRAGKLEFLKGIDLLCVPTTYQEPKGLFVLEGLAAGVPYLQPAHGAFPEMHARAAAGRLFDPADPTDLPRLLCEALANVAELHAIGLRGREHVLQHATTDHEARRLTELLDKLVR